MIESVLCDTQNHSIYGHDAPHQTHFYQTALSFTLKRLANNFGGILYCVCEHWAVALAVLAKFVFARTKKPRQLFGKRIKPA